MMHYSQKHLRKTVIQSKQLNYQIVVPYLCSYLIQLIGFLGFTLYVN